CFNPAAHLMRRIAVRKKPDLIKAKRFIGSLSQHEMSIMDRIKGTSHNSNLHTLTSPMEARSFYSYLFLPYTAQFFSLSPVPPGHGYALPEAPPGHGDRPHSFSRRLP